MKEANMDYEFHSFGKAESSVTYKVSALRSNL